MESTARFSNSFLGKVVASGSKVSGSAFPTLTVTSTKDKFVLNSKALALMGLTEGSYVVMIDLNRGEAVENDHNKRYFLTQGWDKGKGQFEGAKIGKGGGYSYAGIYSAILMDKPEISEATVKDLVDAGKGILRPSPTDEKKEAFIGLQKVLFKVERLSDDDGNTDFQVAEGIYQKVYALTEMSVVAHDPKSLPDENEGVE